MTTNRLLVPRKSALQEAFSQAQHFHQQLHGKLRSQGVDEETARKVAQSFAGHVVLSKQAADGLVRDDLANLLAIQNWSNAIPQYLTWHWPSANGTLTSTTSDPRTTKFAGSLRMTSVDVLTFSTNFTLVIQRNALTVQTINITKGGVGQTFKLPVPQALAPYKDQLTLFASTPGTGNIGIFVTAEVW